MTGEGLPLSPGGLWPGRFHEVGQLGAFRRLASFFWVLALGSPVLYAQYSGSVRVAWEEGLKPPYLMLKPNGLPTGIAVDLINEVFRRSHIRVEPVVQPWQRCLEALKTGTATLVPNASYQAARAAYAYYSEPLYETHLVLFYNKNRFPRPPAIKTLDDLTRYSVMGVLGFNYDRYQSRVPVDSNAQDRESLIHKLVLGRGDLAAEQKEVILYMGQQGTLDLGRIGFISDPTQSVQTFYVLVSRLDARAKELLGVLNSGIEGLKADGTYQKIVDRYLGAE